MQACTIYTTHPHTSHSHTLTPTHLTFSHPHTSHSHTHTPHILTPSPPRTAGVWQRQGDLHLYVHCSSSLQLPSLYLCCTLSVVRGVVWVWSGWGEGAWHGTSLKLVGKGCESVHWPGNLLVYAVHCVWGDVAWVWSGWGWGMWMGDCEVCGMRVFGWEGGASIRYSAVHEH